MECRRFYEHVVIPVFYEIEPSHVRYQEGSYKTAFARYEAEANISRNFANSLIEWKAALASAANISGWVSRTYRDDSQLIDDIVKDVWKMLSLMYPNELKDLVQIDENNKYIESLLKKHQSIGIWGFGGMGKTTIAKQIFAKHFAQYDSVCLLENVRENTETFGVTHIRTKLICELLRRQVTESEIVGLRTFIKRRLTGKKVLIALDDVGDTEQLDELCRYLDELGQDSRLIITTRNRHMLNGRVHVQYKVKKWKLDESLKLFSLGAFKQSHPKEGYEDLSKRAVAYAGGIPLALKVLGSYFHSRDSDFWESELNHLVNNGESLSKIEKVFKGSYNELTQREKEIFLDIAFFFKEENKDFTTRILNACGFNATGGIKLLQEKALVTISNSGRIQMHDLLQKVALQIVQCKKNCSRKDPGERSRLCDIKEIRDVFKSSRDTHKVEGILFDLSQKLKLDVQVDTFKKMTELRFLRLYVPLGKKRLTSVSIPEYIMPFSDKLRYLEWDGYLLKTLPQPFCAELLVEIRLPHSEVEHLWHGMQELPNLEGIDLTECKQLTELPDLSGASKLKWLYLSGCESLCEIEPHVFSNDTLVTLILDNCIKLQSLTCGKHLTSLEKINVYGCSSLQVFSLSSDSIERLDLSKTGTEKLHSSIGHMKKLVYLNLEGLRLSNLPSELSCLKSLTELRLSNCDIVTGSNLEAVFDSKLRSLKILYLKDCVKLLELPTNVNSLSSLYELRLDGSNLEILPVSIEGLSELEIMSLNNCRNLRFLPKLPPHIKEFHADNCTSLVRVFTLNTFSESMKGENKYISFKNDMELDESSLVCMTEGAILTMKTAALHNMSIEKYSLKTHSYNYDSVVVSLPGSSVPMQFEYQTTDSTSITLDITKFHYYSRGFIFCVVVSPSLSYGTREHGGVQIQCQCFMKNGSNVGVVSKWHHKAIEDLNMNHVFFWYDPYHFDSIHYFFDTVSFEFSVSTDSGEQNDFFSIKECGIYPIYISEFPTLLDNLSFEERIQSYLRLKIWYNLEMLESYKLREEKEKTTLFEMKYMQNW
ncbi:disease resistance-like protein DSC1 [Cicer arietinum]|nr:disease resistance-like protein DSC1 [Cicer arietinum]